MSGGREGEVARWSCNGNLMDVVSIFDSVMAEVSKVQAGGQVSSQSKQQRQA
jgi:hypothetical protein